MSPYHDAENDSFDLVSHHHQQSSFGSSNCVDSAFDPSVTVAFTTTVSDSTQHDISKNNRSVSFYKTIKVYKIPNTDRLSMRQKKAMWWSMDELDAIRLRDRKLARGQSRWGEQSKQSNSNTNNATTCSLGLVTPGERKSQNELIERSRTTVLREQDEQHRNGVSDPDRLALKYWDTAQKSRREATKMAFELADEIQKQDTIPTPPKRKSPTKVTQMKKQIQSNRFDRKSVTRTTSSNSTIQLVW